MTNDNSRCGCGVSWRFQEEIDNGVCTICLVHTVALMDRFTEQRIARKTAEATIQEHKKRADDAELESRCHEMASQQHLQQWADVRATVQEYKTRTERAEKETGKAVRDWEATNRERLKAAAELVALRERIRALAEAGGGHGEAVYALLEPLGTPEETE